MTWIKLDDNFGDHENVAGLPTDAKWLFVCSLLWCSRHLSDGRLPAPTIVNRIAGIPERSVEAATAALVEAGLWRETKAGGVRVHNYKRHQRSRAQVEAERLATRERVAKWRDKKQRSNGVGNGVGNAAQNREETEADTPLSPPEGTNDYLCLRCGPDGWVDLGETGYWCDHKPPPELRAVGGSAQ
jgi:hypothetical protein